MFPGYTKPVEEGDALLKRITSLLGDMAELAIQLRTQRDEEGEFEVFFPEMGSIGVGCVEIGGGVETDDDEDEDEDERGVYDADEGRSHGKANGDSGGMVQKEGGEENGDEEECERWVVGGLAWPGLKKGGEVVRPAEVLVVAEGLGKNGA
jgi:hypothetical protein